MIFETEIDVGGSTMKRAGWIIAGVASAALFATSAAAVDAPPIGVAGTALPAAPVDTGPELTVDIGAFALGLFSGGPVLATQIFGVVEAEWASGWGTVIEIFGGAQLIPFGGFGGGLSAQIHRSVGDFQLGLIAEAFVPGGYAVGAVANFERESGRFTVKSENMLWFLPGLGFDSYNRIDFQATERLLVEAWIDLWDCGGFCWRFDTRATYDVTAMLKAWAEVDIANGGLDQVGFGVEFDPAGPLEIDADVWFDGGGFNRVSFLVDYELSEVLDFVLEGGFDGGFFIAVGLDLDDQIGNGPFSLIGFTRLGFSSGGGFGAIAAVGIRYTLGDVDDDFVFGF